MVAGYAEVLEGSIIATGILAGPLCSWERGCVLARLSGREGWSENRFAVTDFSTSF